jgi:hypothetical protein
MQDFYRCEPTYEEKARAVAKEACKNLIHNMHYEARIQAVIDWHAINNKIVYKKEVARKMELTREQYLSVSTSILYQLNDLRNETCYNY